MKYTTIVCLKACNLLCINPGFQLIFSASSAGSAAASPLPPPPPANYAITTTTTTTITIATLHLLLLRIKEESACLNTVFFNRIYV